MSLPVTPLRILFAGTPDFAAISLAALLSTPHQVVGVLTQPDRPAGRGRALMPSDVKKLALEHGLPVLQPERLQGEEIAATLASFDADVMVVVAYGLLVPQRILDLPRHGCINVHGSLLPRWRGAAPVHRAIAAGDRESGVTIMQMEAGLDTGPMLYTVTTPITDEDTGGTLYQRIAALGAEALVTVLADLPGFLAQATVQPEVGVTYAHKLGKEEALLDWHLPAEQLQQQIRAFNPWPVAQTPFGQQMLRIWAATVADGAGLPGTVLVATPETLEVACGNGSLRITSAQLPGKKAQPIKDMLSGRSHLLVSGRPLSSGFGAPSQ